MSENQRQGGNRPPRFTLRTFLVSVAILGTVIGWRMMKTQPEREHLVALRFLELGASVRFDYGASGGITAILVRGPADLSDAHLEHLEDLPHLEMIQLHLTQVTDRGLLHLSKAPTLRRIHINENHISDVGIENLRKLPNLESVHVHDHRTVWDETYGPQTDKLRRALPEATTYTESKVLPVPVDNPTF